MSKRIFKGIEEEAIRNYILMCELIEGKIVRVEDLTDKQIKDIIDDYKNTVYSKSKDVYERDQKFISKILEGGKLTKAEFDSLDDEDKEFYYMLQNIK